MRSGCCGCSGRSPTTSRYCGAKNRPTTRRGDPLWLRGVKYTFVTAIEACVDVAQHICASEGWGPPNDNGHALSLLGEHGVLPTALARRLRQAVGFRNVLVHEYVDVDDDIVRARLHDPSDVADFVRAVTEWTSKLH
ncbi:MAG TPA: DUF86 domain-containing protein [Pseudonocardia sp.]|uniref:type VII toxin-antitoxin system HepT family RNase toxin n=1 Tax=Pseudonocardia sp. TaxID=60912 RepID=UPI002F3F0746